MSKEVLELTIKTGDLVGLLTGQGPTMVVAAVQKGVQAQTPPGTPMPPPITMIECVYFDGDNRLQVARIPVECLKQAKRAM
jgi:uncharacterized protein YodC (DUF2158 family)